MLTQILLVSEAGRPRFDGQVGVVTGGASGIGAKTFVDLLAQANGSIVLTSSVNAYVGRPGRPAYAASKAGLAALGRQLAVEYGPDVRTNTVVAGAILTPPWEAVPEEHRART